MNNYDSPEPAATDHGPSNTTTFPFRFYFLISESRLWRFGDWHISAWVCNFCFLETSPAWAQAALPWTGFLFFPRAPGSSFAPVVLEKSKRNRVGNKTQ